MQNQTKIKLIAISKIFILNPRERNKLVLKEIKENIENIGLKRPITVCYKTAAKGEYEYDLVCGQGRLEAYIACNQTEIPAIIIDVNEEKALIMSLVENIARKNYHPSELFKGVKRLKGLGYSNNEIANKIGVTNQYISDISILLERGEEELLNNVEHKKIPLNVAIKISSAPNSEVQAILQEAYNKGDLRGDKLRFVHKLIQRRQKNAKNVESLNISKKMTSKELYKQFEDIVAQKQLFIRKASKVENMLIAITHNFKNLFENENFTNLLKAEGIIHVPQYIIERIKQNEKNS